MNVSKKTIFISITLVCLIWASILFFRYQANQDNENFFNQYLRHHFIKWNLAKSLFHLNYDGDNRAIYFSQQYPVITLEIDALNGVIFDRKVIEDVAQELGKILEKKVQVNYSNLDITNSFTSQDLQVIADKYKNFSPDSPSLYVLILDMDNQNKDRLGTTFSRDSVALYIQSIESMSQNLTDGGLNFKGTLLHEIGHQLGLPHNDKYGCLMNAEAEEGPSYIYSAFCEYELELISAEKQRYK